MQPPAAPQPVLSIWFCMGVLLVFVGLFKLFGSLDAQWERYESRRRAQGFTNMEQTPEWESQTRMSGCVAVILGLFFFFMAMLALSSGSRSSSNYPYPPGQVWVDGTPVPSDQVPNFTNR